MDQFLLGFRTMRKVHNTEINFEITHACGSCKQLFFSFFSAFSNALRPLVYWTLNAVIQIFRCQINLEWRLHQISLRNQIRASWLWKPQKYLKLRKLKMCCRFLLATIFFSVVTLHFANGIQNFSVNESVQRFKGSKDSLKLQRKTTKKI